MDVREVTLTLDFCLRVGELLLSSGAGAADVTATIRSLARHFEVGTSEIDVTYINLSMSYQDTAEDVPVHVHRQVKVRTIDYDHLTQVDHLIRDVLRGEVDLKEARLALGRIVSGGHGRPRWVVTLGVGFMAAAIAVQMGAATGTTVLATVSALIIDRMTMWMNRRRIPSFYQQTAGAGVATLLALAAAIAPIHIDVSRAITANIIVLLAGIGFLGALQDALTGFHITASARVMEVMMSTSGIIAGVTGGLELAQVLGVTLPTVVPGATGLPGVSLSLVGAAFGAVGFAYSSYAPGRSLMPIALMATVAYGITIALPGAFDKPWQVGVASFFIGTVAYFVAGQVQVPPLVLVVSGLVPMLPGLSIYRGLTMLAHGTAAQSAQGVYALFTAGSVAVALAAGAILGEYVVQPVKGSARRLEARLAGPRLVGPARPVSERRRRRRQLAAARRRQHEQRRRHDEHSPRRQGSVSGPEPPTP